MFATSPGQTFVVSNFNTSLTTGLGLSPSRLAASYLVGTLASAALLPRAGRLADRIGPRRMIMLSSFGLAAAGFALSRSIGLVSLTLAFFLLRFFGQGVISLASSHALALRFDGRLGSVEGLRGATVSGAIAFAPQIAIAWIALHGWRDAAWMLGVGAGALALFASVVLMDPDPSPTEEETPAASDAPMTAAHSFSVAAARRTRALWILVGSSTLVGTLLTAVHFHLQPILAESGMGPETAASTFASFAGAGLVATLIGGVLIDRFRASHLLGVAMLQNGAGMMLIARASTPLEAHIGMGLLGFGHGLGGAVGAPTLARYFGRQHHGAIRGFAGTCVVAGSAAGPILLGSAAESIGSFETALFGLAILFVPAACFGFVLRKPEPGSPGDRSQGG